jgi:transcriptional repressor NrdR
VHCPFCRHTDSRVVDSRATDDGATIRRRRQCPECGRRFTTVETASVSVVKRSGASEPFSRSKVLAGVRKACQGRPVTEDDLAVLAQRVEEAIRGTGQAEVPADEVGLAVLEPLRHLDEVAYLRFASVYQGFDSLTDFEDAITLLRAERDAGSPGPRGAWADGNPAADAASSPPAADAAPPPPAADAALTLPAADAAPPPRGGRTASVVGPQE